jgi:GntR family transcriptional regulator
MVDTIHPQVRPRSDARLRKAMERGDMVIDVLVAEGVPLAYANTRIVPRLTSARERVGKALGLTGTTAVLELEETYHITSGELVQFSTDIFAPGVLDLHVIRWIESSAPVQVSAAARNGAGSARRGRRRRR